jgi:RNA polymerase sigma factor (sigma-70 family)
MYTEHITRHTLLKRASNPEDGEAWTEFVDIYHNFIKIFLIKLRIPQQESEDITQLILVRLWKNLSKYDSNVAKFRTWLVTIIRNTAYSHMTSMSKKQHVSLDGTEILALMADDRQDELEKRYENEWEIYITKLALKNVSKNFRGQAVEAFTMTLDGKSTQEISTTLELKPQSVRNLKNRVKVSVIKEIERLRTELETKTPSEFMSRDGPPS